MSVIRSIQDPRRDSYEECSSDFKSQVFKKIEETFGLDDFDCQNNKITTNGRSLDDFDSQVKKIQSLNFDKILVQVNEISRIKESQFLSWQNAKTKVTEAKNYKLSSKQKNEHVKNYHITSIWRDTLKSKINAYIKDDDYSFIGKINLNKLSEAFDCLARTYEKVFVQNVIVITLDENVFCSLKEKYGAIAKDLEDLGAVIVGSKAPEKGFEEHNSQTPKTTSLKPEVEKFAITWGLTRRDSFRKKPVHDFSTRKRGGSGIRNIQEMS